MAERIELTLAESRALLARIERKQLEAGDWAVVDALLSEVIAQADPGQQWLTIEFSDEEDTPGSETGGAVGVEVSTSDGRRR
jgi:hypothetical protein